MSVYNEPLNILKNSVNSILKQTYSDFEFIIVVDNPALDTAIEYLNKQSTEDSRIKLMINSTNQGLVKSLNKGLKVAKGEFIARMDADDIADHKRLQIQKDFLISNDLDFVFSDVKTIDEDGNIIDDNVFGGSNIIGADEFTDIMYYSNIAFHPTWFANKQLFDKLDGYREINTAEDYDFIIRALRNDAKFGYISMPLVSYRYRRNGISRSNGLIQYRTASIIKQGLKVKNYPNWESNSVQKVRNKISQLDNGRKDKFNNAVYLGTVFSHDKNIKNLIFMGIGMMTSFEAVKFSFRTLKVRKEVKNFFETQV